MCLRIPGAMAGGLVSSEGPGEIHGHMRKSLQYDQCIQALRSFPFKGF